MTTSNWIKITPPPALAALYDVRWSLPAPYDVRWSLPAPYDGKWYWVQFFKVDNPVIVLYTNGCEWINQRGQKFTGYLPIAYQPYIEPEPYVESES
jgi:hypothetical protein